jgi:SAM-dependent methyltransferase
VERDILPAVEAYYSAQLARFGPVPLGVDWSSAAAQTLRFDVLLRAIRPEGPFSLLDYGCGYGALTDHLAARGLGACRYVGYDISDAMLRAASSRPGALDHRRFVGAPEALPEVDYCVASGVFNVSLGVPPEAWFAYMAGIWDEMSRLSRVAFAFNCLSALAEGPKRLQLLYYADPARVFEHCRRTYAPFVSLLHDYPLPEFTLVVRKSPG